MSVDTHPSVDELYTMIQRKHPSISRATIYRNMKQFVKNRIILQIAVANDVSRYDGCTDFHQHFVCDDCGRVLDVPIDSDSEADISSIQNKYNHKIDRYMTTYFGTCSDCI